MRNGYYKRLLDNANDLIWAIDMEGMIIYINGKISEWGYDKDELMGRPILNILDIRHMGKKMSEPAGMGTMRTFEMQVEDKLGKLHRVVASSSPLQDDDGSIVGMMGIIHDVTEKYNLEEKLRHEERLASLGRLATGVAHEIRNPLSSVKMNLAILAGRLKPTAENLEHFNIAQEGVANLERIVTEFLDYARPMPLAMKRQSINDAIKGVVEMARPHCAENNVSISTEFAKNMRMAFFDKGKIQQAILNILINAIQASKKNGIVEVKTLLANANQAKIIVSDKGGGISAADLKFVFDPFFTTKQDGTGLGLSIVRSIMRSHKGDISISSKVGDGTRVTLELPTR